MISLTHCHPCFLLFLNSVYLELIPHACSPLRGNPTFISTRAHTSDASKLWIFSSGCIENFGLHPTNVRTLLSAGAAIGQGFGEQGCPSVTAGADSKHTAKIVHANPANPALLDGCDAFKARPVSLATSLLSLLMSLAAGACRTAAFPSMLWPSALGAHKFSPRENFFAHLLLSPEIDHHVFSYEVMGAFWKEVIFDFLFLKTKCDWGKSFLAF